MKVLVTGATGMLGSAILPLLSVVGYTATALNRIDFLQSNRENRREMLRGYDAIIHAAANTNVEQCEIESEAAYHDNTFLTELLFSQAYQLGIKFVFISSTGVYGRGKLTPYHEYDSVSPTTVHHRSKHLAEQIVLADVSSLIIRTGWLFGGALDSPKNFVAGRLRDIRAADHSIQANSSQIGSPTYVEDLAQRILELLEENCAGIYNVVNSGSASRFAYIKQIVELSCASIVVEPIDASGFKRHADVSENEAAISYRMKFEGRPTLRPWQEALEDYMSRAGLLPSTSSIKS
jgi:dTDP-4-dehydrorhamnose reductase